MGMHQEGVVVDGITKSAVVDQMQQRSSFDVSLTTDRYCIDSSTSVAI